VIVLATVWGIKYSYNKHLRNSHFLLAVFCRAENNRHYLGLGLELRPGFLGKWIEISIVDTGAHRVEQLGDIIEDERQKVA